MEFNLDPRLANDSVLLGKIDQCQIRLMNDRRWLWVILIPEINDAEELFDLSNDQAQSVTRNINLASRSLKELTNCTKVNVGALGNMVRQLHIHIIARHEGDANWPGPVWGFEERIPYASAQQKIIIQQLSKLLF